MLLKNIPNSIYSVWHYVFRAFSLLVNSIVHSWHQHCTLDRDKYTYSLTSLLHFWRQLRDPLAILHQDLKLFLSYCSNLLHFGGTGWRNWLRHCATSRRVAGSIRDGVTGIFRLRNPSDHSGPEVDSRECQEHFSWKVKAASAYGWQSYHLHMPTVLKTRTLNLLEPLGPLQACKWTILHL